MAEMMNFMYDYGPIWPNVNENAKPFVADSILSFCWLNVLNPPVEPCCVSGRTWSKYVTITDVCIWYTEVIGTIRRI